MTKMKHQRAGLQPKSEKPDGIIAQMLVKGQTELIGDNIVFFFQYREGDDN